jgi:hypothetical protein
MKTNTCCRSLSPNNFLACKLQQTMRFKIRTQNTEVEALPPVAWESRKRSGMLSFRNLRGKISCAGEVGELVVAGESGRQWRMRAARFEAMRARAAAGIGLAMAWSAYASRAWERRPMAAGSWASPYPPCGCTLRRRRGSPTVTWGPSVAHVGCSLAGSGQAAQGPARGRFRRRRKGRRTGRLRRQGIGALHTEDGDCESGRFHRG